MSYPARAEGVVNMIIPRKDTTFICFKLKHHCSVSCICRIRRLHIFRGVRLPPTRTSLPIGCEWWLLMLADGVHVAKQSVTRQPKWSCNLQHSILGLTRLDGRLEMPDLINRLVMSNPSTNIIIRLYSSNCSYGNQTPNTFYLKAAKKQSRWEKKDFDCPGYNAKLHLIIDQEFGECKVSIHYHLLLGPLTQNSSSL